MQHLKLLKLASKSRASTGQEGLRVDATCVKNCEDSNMVWVYTASIPPVKSESTNTNTIQISLIQYDKRIHINEYNK